MPLPPPAHFAQAVVGRLPVTAAMLWPGVDLSLGSVDVAKTPRRAGLDQLATASASDHAGLDRRSDPSPSSAVSLSIAVLFGTPRRYRRLIRPHRCISSSYGDRRDTEPRPKSYCASPKQKCRVEARGGASPCWPACQRSNCGDRRSSPFCADCLGEREAGVGERMLSSANADAPTSLSSVLLLGLHGIGGTTDDMSAYRRISTPRSDEQRVTPSPSISPNVRPGAKRRRPGYPQ